jgi:hypothetical protein
MIINFSNIGISLGTRILGSKVRSQIESALSDNQFVTFDLTGVDTMSHSFADECFGKLVLNKDISFIKKNSTFKGAKKEVETIILFTIKERLSQLQTA